MVEGVPPSIGIMKNLHEAKSQVTKWDEGTLHLKMNEVIDIVEWVKGKVMKEGITERELRVALNEITRRTPDLLDCKERFPKAIHKINIVLRIADDWIRKISIRIYKKKADQVPSTRKTIKEGFRFLSEETRNAMLKEFDGASD